MTRQFETTADGQVVVDGYTFPPFDLVRLLRTVFDLGEAESFGVFTDLPNPREVVGLAYLEKEGYGPQKHAYHTLYKGLLSHAAELGAREAAFYGYEETGGSNLDLPDTVVTPDGEDLSLVHPSVHAGDHLVAQPSKRLGRLGESLADGGRIESACRAKARSRMVLPGQPTPTPYRGISAVSPAVGSTR